jgi:hypothetical protein
VTLPYLLRIFTCLLSNSKSLPFFTVSWGALLCNLLSAALRLTLTHSRLARRGGVKRISAGIYDDAREALKAHLSLVSGHFLLYTSLHLID